MFLRAGILVLRFKMEWLWNMFLPVKR